MNKIFAWFYSKKKNQTLPLFMDGVQPSQGYRATTRRQFTFYHSVPRSSWYSFNLPWKDERLSWPQSHPVVLNPGSLDCKPSALITRPFPDNHFQKNPEISQVSYGFPALKSCQNLTNFYSHKRFTVFPVHCNFNFYK